jgi:hypothetical protein
VRSFKCPTAGDKRQPDDRPIYPSWKGLSSIAQR